ncbi:glycosyltransferase family 32 protein [[Candida] arabinofermentans NRRL YB-2248]|uniref:Glycosyltransferase family 32 protein n=1 Tax=[Candida] arabinofermentans NRRL YB-2248 TaxID=983967 RepID=A0A1E4SY42_9ASCO|nr:glycosyltransferase family 32 protein [[Candida] arabinofermentans NRRL YB-2248]
MRTTIQDIFRTYKYFISATVGLIILLNIVFQSSNELDPASLNKTTRSKSTTTTTQKPHQYLRNLQTIESRLGENFPYDPTTEIEKNIWQFWSDVKSLPNGCGKLIDIFKSDDNLKDGEWTHHLNSTEEILELVSTELIQYVPEVQEALAILPHPRLRYEFLRYLLIFIKGGLYADIDIKLFKPLRYWYESRYESNQVYLMIESDYNDLQWESLYNRRLAFSNSLFMCKSNHPFLAKLIAKITYIIHTKKEHILSINWDEQFKIVDANNEPTVSITSQSILTDMLFDYINDANKEHILISVSREGDPETNVKNIENHESSEFSSIYGPEVPENLKYSYKSFTLSVAPTQIDDIVILPYISIHGMGDEDEDEQLDVENSINEGYKKYYYAKSMHLTPWTLLVNN